MVNKMTVTNMKVETMTNPTNSKPAPSSHRKSRRNSRADKIWSAGLAATTCIGIVGVIGVRSVEANADAAASQPATTDIALVSSNVPTTSTGLTQADLEAYAAALAAESAKLDSYRASLVDAANALRAASGQSAVKQPTVQQPSVQRPKVTRPPAAQSAPQSAPAPQSNTKSS